MDQPVDNITAWRADLRRRMIARRQAWSSEAHAAASRQIVAHLVATLPAPNTLGFCWPIRREPDVRGIFEVWPKTRFALPKVVAAGTPLQFYEWLPGEPLEADRYGIPTPVSGKMMTPEVLLVPLNAFDPSGYRLGYGGGFFDRTLSCINPMPLVIGVGFDMNCVPSIHPAEHDVPMHRIVTESGWIR